jgi:hypothetical protein
VLGSVATSHTVAIKHVFVFIEHILALDLLLLHIRFSFERFDALEIVLIIERKRSWREEHLRDALIVTTLEINTCLIIIKEFSMASSILILVVVEWFQEW